MEEYHPTSKTKSRISRFQFQNCKKRCFLDVNNVILTFYKINLKWLKKRHEAGIMARLQCSVIFFLRLGLRHDKIWQPLSTTGGFAYIQSTREDLKRSAFIGQIKVSRLMFKLSQRQINLCLCTSEKEWGELKVCWFRVSSQNLPLVCWPDMNWTLVQLTPGRRCWNGLVGATPTKSKTELRKWRSEKKNPKESRR